MKVSAVVLAGGEGSRFGARVPKAFMSLNGKPVIQHSIDVIEPLVDEIIIVSEDPYRDYRHAAPGSTRSDSALNGVEAARYDKILIHDAVRPFITPRIVRQVLDAVATHPSVDTAVPIIDGYLIDDVPFPKRGRWLGQTPEAFDRATLLQAFTLAGHAYDDEVGMVFDTLGIPPFVVSGVQLNTKITFPKDLENAEAVLRNWHEPLWVATRPTGRVLLLGGSGGIGSALKPHLVDYDAPTRSELDVSSGFDLDLGPYSTVIHAAGEYDGPGIMAVNFGSVVRLADLAVAQEWTGNIVVFSSTAASYGRRGMAVYSASKAALNAWIEASHEDLASQGIFVNAVAPAKVDTRLQATLNPSVDASEMMTAEYVAQRTLPYLATNVHGHIVYLRVGFDG
jgi:2-C-methyl-D-erythritol 4-phosphate cytidylyltransferase